MSLKDGDLLYERDLDGFDLRSSKLGEKPSSVITNLDKPIGIYRAIYKNGLVVQSWVQPIENKEE